MTAVGAGECVCVCVSATSQRRDCRVPVPAYGSIFPLFVNACAREGVVVSKNE